ncbi:MAG: SAM-dependent methyltransferase [Verrucomicrobiota bacterium]
MSLVATRIKNEIELRGVIPFARFMEMALYWPGEGYYETHQQIGRAGDFITSVSVGDLFGEILACQFVEWLQKFSNDDSGSEQVPDNVPLFQIVEAGAHEGKLAYDILTWLSNNSPELFNRLEYCVIEPSSSRQSWQQKTLEDFQNVRWVDELSAIPVRGKVQVDRIIFSNELFDSMPVHRFGWDAQTKSWFEWAVGWNGKNFTWKRASENQRSSVPVPQVNPALLEVLPDDFTTEVCPAAVEWWAKAAKFLHRGKIVAIDYGLTAEQIFVPERRHGTLRAISRHHINTDLLSMLGEQDITAHVNFSALKTAGENVGLKTDALMSQSQFLSGIVERNLNKLGTFTEWNSAHRRQFQTLTHPEHFGRAFRVLVQSR